MSQIKKQIDLDQDDVSWFYEIYGENASLGWILTLLLRKFREVHTHSPSDYAELGAKLLKEQLEDEA